MRTDALFGTRIAAADAASIGEGAQLLRDGRLIAFPTETVYGLGANALDDLAVSSIFSAKMRPRFNPLIVHVQNWQQATEFVEPNSVSEAIAGRFWPGGVTLVLPRRRCCAISLLASGGLDTVAVRAPSHEVAQALIQRTGIPIAAPSANRAGRISPTSANACLEELEDRVPLILDGGPCPLGIESTVIGFENDTPVLLRPGAISREEIEGVTGHLLVLNNDTVRSPGMQASHYAPKAKLRLNADHAGRGEALLAFGARVRSAARHVCNLSPSGDLREAAANLFAMLRQLDNTDASVIAVMPIPDGGLGEAINDRLYRAAAPRE